MLVGDAVLVRAGSKPYLYIAHPQPDSPDMGHLEPQYSGGAFANFSMDWDDGCASFSFCSFLRPT
jgi:hypothetical protein